MRQDEIGTFRLSQLVHRSKGSQTHGVTALWSSTRSPLPREVLRRAKSGWTSSLACSRVVTPRTGDYDARGAGGAKKEPPVAWRLREPRSHTRG